MLQVKKVTKQFGGLTAVSTVEFSLDNGEIVGLIGPNGAGKTTMFNLISGNLCLDSGEIDFNGERISGLKPNQICRKGIARTFQAVRIFSHMTVLENVSLALLFGNCNSFTKAESFKKAEELLEFVNLKEASGSQAGDLTMIKQKRLELARALATDPKLLLLDELMAGLTPTEVSEAMELIKRISEKDISILMVEHVMKAIMSICDRIIVFNNGVKICEGSPKEIANDQEVIKVYLGEEGSKYAEC